MKSIILTSFLIAGTSLAQSEAKLAPQSFWKNYGNAEQLKYLPQLEKLLKTPQHLDWREKAELRIQKHRVRSLAVKLVDQAGNPIDGAEVSASLSKHQFLFGGVLNTKQLLGQENASIKARYQELAPKFFNAAGFQNAFKPKLVNLHKNIEPSLKFLQQHNLPVRGQTLILPSWRHLPKDFDKLKNRPEELKTACEEMIVNWSKKWPQPIEWDLINEPRGNHEVQDILGFDIEKKWFDLAQSNLPKGTKLYMNDFQIVSGTRPAYKDFFENFAKRHLKQGSPIHGLGFQNRFKTYISPHEVWQSLDRFSKLGLDLKGTEFEIVDKIQVMGEAKRARITEEVLINFYSCEKVNGLFAWTFFNRGSSLPNAKGADKRTANWGLNSGLVDHDGVIKLNGLVWLYYTQYLWKPNTESTTNKQGMASSQLHKGEYTITVKVKGKTYTHPYSLDNNSNLD